MVKIKRINTINDDLRHKIFNFFNLSKPYDFCQIKSPQLRNQQIKEYVEDLEKSQYIYVAHYDQKFVGIIFFTKREQIYLDFVFGDFKMGPTKLIEAFYLCLRQVCEDSNSKMIEAEMIRKYKKNIYLKWLQRYDKKCKFIYQDPKIILEWHPYEW